MIRGYLIDTNHVGALFREEPKVMARANLIPPENLPRVCAITLGEIEAGHGMISSTDPFRRDEFLTFINKNFLRYSLPVTFGTRESYAEIVGRILTKHPMSPSTPNKRTERHLVEIGVDLNDVWIAAVALEHGMVLVTHDKMERIKEALASDLVFEDWL